MNLLLTINVGILFFIFFITKVEKFRAFSSSAINPIFFIAFLGFFFILDFYFLYDSVIIDIFEYGFVIGLNDIVDGFFIYTSFNTVFFLVILYVTFFSKTTFESREYFVFPKDVAKKCFWFIQFILVLILTVNAGLFIQMFAGEVTRQIAFSNSQLIYIVFTLILPSFAVYASSHGNDFKKLLIAFLFSAFFIVLSGSRGNLLLLIIIVMFVYSFKVRKINSMLLFLSIPIVGFVLLLTRYFFREAWRYNSIWEFIEDKGGLGHVFFSTAEISMAEVIVTVNVWKEELIRYPFESFIGGIMFPLPRSIFTFKPISSGGVLTDLLSPMRWELTRSEIVTTGYGDLIMQFGFVGGLIVFGLMVFFWCRVVFKVLNMSMQSMIVLLPFLLWWPYMFIRADVFNMFSSVWSFLLVFFICLTIKKLRV